ncbi:hypothetical protein DFH28DRAFT_920861 [Melampsora americana]|nr:hypothetical protein DFH28DRAFT_920861 [Melampsora americana]
MQAYKRDGYESKKFIQNFLTSTNKVIKEQRGKWGTSTGWKSTKLLMTTIGGLVKDNKENGLTRWSKEFILEEAKEIVNHQDPPSGEPPNGMFYNSKNVTHTFFDDNAEKDRMSVIESSMDFMHSLIKFKLGYATVMCDNQIAARMEKHENREREELEDREGDIDGDTFLKRSPNALPRIEEHRLNKLPAIVCSMISFACNRQHSAMQLQNLLTFLACGVTEKMSNFLHFLGLSLSQQTANEAMDTLTEETE